MEEMYILHQLEGHTPSEDEFTSEPECLENEALQEETTKIEPTPQDTEAEPCPEAAPEQVSDEWARLCPDWEMELAQAYVRHQPLDGIFPPEEGLMMGTAFPNLSKPYEGRQ